MANNLNGLKITYVDGDKQRRKEIEKEMKKKRKKK